MEAGTVVTVGRHSAAELRIDDPRVSRRHLRLLAVGDAWVAEDAGSSYGVYVDGQRLDRFRIVAETIVRLGDPELGPWLRLTPLGGIAAPVATPPQAGSEPATIRIGRGSANDLVLDDLLVSRHHAELRALPDGRLVLVDLGSFNGTFVNGRQIDEVVLTEGDLVGIGRSQLRLTGSRLEVQAEGGAVALVAAGISVETRSGSLLVDDVGFAVDEGTLLAVVGPSGAGKSTLLGALSGLKQAARGSVYFGGRDLYADYDALRQRIGYVPQDDVVHPGLTVAQSLEYAAELRFPPDVSAAERRARVEEVLEELDLTARRDLPVRRLSGGQRKRVSVALELLTQPALLFLDEPTSGLDPGLERSLMQLLRRLADAGRTVVVVTHSVESLALCDRVLFLAPGGRTAFFGPPQLALAYFDRADYQGVFQSLSGGDPREWRERFSAHELGRRYLREPLAGYEAGSRQPATVGAPPGRLSWWRQLWMLTRRYGRVLASDRGNLVMLGLSAPLLGLIALWRLPGGELSPPPLPEIRLVSQASLVLFVLMLSLTLLGLTNAIREIVKEQPLFRRERAIGLSIPAYVVSKLLVLGAIVTLQAAVAVPIVVAAQNGPRDAVLIGWPLGELIVAGAATGIAAVALGLLVSSLSSSVNVAVAILPALLTIQLLLGSGGVFPAAEEKPVLRELSYASSLTWGFGAGASTSELNRLQAIDAVGRKLPTIDLSKPEKLLEVLSEENRGERLWNHEPGAWLRNLGALGAITLVCVVLAGFALRRFDPV